MSNGIVRINNDMIANKNIPEIKVGDVIISNHYGLYRVDKITDDQYGIRIHLVDYYTGHHYSASELRYFDTSKGDSYRVLYGDPESVYHDAIKAMEAGGIDSVINDDSQSTALTISNDKDKLIAYTEAIKDHQNRIVCLERMLMHRMHGLRNKAAQLSKELKQAQRVITLIEIFLGVYEEVVTIRDGQPAGPDTPLCIRQLVLYMDEEVADIAWRGNIRGLDFQCVNDFDAWLISDPSHLNQVLPEERGIVALRATRQRRYYDDNPFVQVTMDKQNQMLYLLIRNGEQLYRVYTDMVEVKTTLFPSQNEMDKIQKDIDRWGEDYDGVQRNKMAWQYKAALLQGLVERTTVLQPMNYQVNLLNPALFDVGHIYLIRDAEYVIGDGNEDYKSWRKRINENIGVGSRVVLTDVAQHIGRDKDSVRYERWRWGERYHNQIPSCPNNGVYTIEDVGTGSDWRDKPKEYYTVRFMPTGFDAEVYDPYYGYKPRKNRLSFRFFKDDPFVLNYDMIDPKDIEYFMSNRLERPQYLDIMPTLRLLHKERTGELEYEALLVRELAQREGYDERSVWDAVTWWKYKVKLHRPIESDDAKAWRMIAKHVKQQINQNQED